MTIDTALNKLYNNDNGHSLEQAVNNKDGNSLGKAVNRTALSKLSKGKSLGQASYIWILKKDDFQWYNDDTMIQWYHDTNKKEEWIQ